MRVDGTASELVDFGRNAASPVHHHEIRPRLRKGFTRAGFV